MNNGSHSYFASQTSDYSKEHMQDSKRHGKEHLQDIKRHKHNIAAEFDLNNTWYMDRYIEFTVEKWFHLSINSCQYLFLVF